MGIFTKNQAVNADNVYKNTKQYLKPKDGFKHILMINSFSKFVNQYFCCDDKYTTQIDEILQRIQNDGYEIVDVKFNVLHGQGIFQTMEGFFTLIIYK